MHRSRLRLTRRSAAAVAAIATATAAALLASGGGAQAAPANHHSGSFIGNLSHTKVIASTIPKNGDVNPYGVAVVPRTTGSLHRGDVLVSNFNDSTNAQGAGTTIVQVNPHDHSAKLFAGITDSACPGGVGLTTALVALRSGWVIVGSLPTMNGSISGPGCLIVLDQWGNVKETITGHGIDGPWDMTALDLGPISELFVTNVLGGILGPKNPNGGTVERLIITSGRHDMPRVLDSDMIGSGFPARTDINALVIGPTGVGLGHDGTLYVADTASSRIAAIPDATFRDSDAGTGTTVSQGNNLNGPLGLAIAPNGHILTVNGNDGNIVETTPHGTQVAFFAIDTNSGGAGNLFGLAVKPHDDAVYFVDDFGMANNLQLFF
jgi:hypothetical protein